MQPPGYYELPGKPHERLPLGGKLSPQVTDEGLPTGSFPLIRRVPRHLPPRGKAFPAGDEVTPPYIAILPQSFLPRPYPFHVRARRALRIYFLVSFIYYLFCPAGALSSPMVHRSAASREITTKKQPYVFRKAVPWCTIGDSNPGPTD